MRSSSTTLLVTAALCALGGCTVLSSPDETVCGAGTVLEGDTCVADPAGVPTPGDGTSGDGTPGDGTPGDGTPGDGTVGGDDPTVPPGGDRPPGDYGDAVGCDEALGECDEWRDAIVDAVLEHQRELCEGRGPEVDPRVQEVAQAHAEHQAMIDMLDASSSAELFEQVFAAGVLAPQMAAAYSQTVEGPEDVIARWLRNRTDAGILTDRCDLYVGAGVATNPDSGWSYVTLLVADYRG